MMCGRSNSPEPGTAPPASETPNASSPPHGTKLPLRPHRGKWISSTRGGWWIRRRQRRPRHRNRQNRVPAWLYRLAAKTPPAWQPGDDIWSWASHLRFHSRGHQRHHPRLTRGAPKDSSSAFPRPSAPTPGSSASRSGAIDLRTGAPHPSPLTIARPGARRPLPPRRHSPWPGTVPDRWQPDDSVRQYIKPGPGTRRHQDRPRTVDVDYGGGGNHPAKSEVPRQHPADPSATPPSRTKPARRGRFQTTPTVVAALFEAHRRGRNQSGQNPRRQVGEEPDRRRPAQKPAGCVGRMGIYLAHHTSSWRQPQTHRTGPRQKASGGDWIGALAGVTIPRG